MLPTVTPVFPYTTVTLMICTLYRRSVFRPLRRPQYTHITVFNCESRVLSHCWDVNTTTLRNDVMLIDASKIILYNITQNLKLQKLHSTQYNIHLY